MRLCRATVFVLALVAVPVPALPPAEDDADVFRLDVCVTDEDGQPVSDLRREDFELFVDGRRVETSAVRAVRDGDGAREPVTVIVFIDNLHLGLARTEALAELRGFLLERLARRDRVIVASFDGRVRLREEITDDGAALERVLDRLAAEPTDGQATRDQEAGVLNDMMNLSDMSRNAGATHCPFQLDRLAKTYSSEVHRRMEMGVAGLTDFVATLASLPGKKALVHLSEGIPYQAGAGLYEVLRQYCSGQDEGVNSDDTTLIALGRSNPAHQSVYDFRRAELAAASFLATPFVEELSRRANAERVTVFPVEATGARNLSASQTHRRLRRTLSRQADAVRAANRRHTLTQIASRTGGRAIVDTKNLSRGLGRIASDLDNFYALDFRLPGAGDAESHDVRVEVSRPGLRVLHRPSVRGRSQLEELAARTHAALLYDRLANPLDVELRVAESQGVDGLHTVPIRLRIPLGKIALETTADGHRGRLRVFVSGRDRNGHIAPVRTVDVPILVPGGELETARSQVFLYEVRMLMRPGGHKVAVAVHDDIAALTSLLTEEVVIAAR